MAAKKSSGPIVTAILEILLFWIHYIVAALGAGVAVITTTVHTAAGTGSAEATAAAGGFSVAMIPVSVWGGTIAIFVGGICLIVGTILSYKDKVEPTKVFALIAKICSFVLWAIAAYIFYACGFLASDLSCWFYLACVPTALFAFFMGKSAKTLKKSVE